MTTQDKIKKACRKAYAELVEQGKRPTVNAVSSLVTGDRNAISKALKELREEYQVDNDGCSIRLPGAITRAMEQVYLDLKGGIEDDCQKSIEAIQGKLDRGLQSNATLKEDVNSLTLELEALKALLEEKTIQIDGQNAQLKNNEVELTRLVTLTQQQAQQISSQQENKKEILAQIESERGQSRHQITHMLEQAREIKDEKDALTARQEAITYEYREFKMDSTQSIRALETSLAKQAQQHMSEINELKITSQQALAQANSQAEKEKAILITNNHNQLTAINDWAAKHKQLNAELEQQRKQALEINNVLSVLKSSLSAQQENNRALTKAMENQSNAQ
jgi:chromosome segregation ATPase